MLLQQKHKNKKKITYLLIIVALTLSSNRKSLKFKITLFRGVQGCAKGVQGCALY